MATTSDTSRKPSFVLVDETTTDPHVSPRVEESVDDHFGGKRDGERTPTLLRVRVSNGAATFAGLTVNVSRSGVLIRLLEEPFRTASQNGDLMRYGGCVRRHLKGDVRIRFSGTGIVRKVEMVRAETACDVLQPVVLGCRFKRPFSDEELGKLVVPEQD